MVPERLRLRGDETARSWVPEAGRVGAAGIGALTVFVRMLVFPLGTRQLWAHSGHSTSEPGVTSVTSIVEWQDGHCRILAMASSSPRIPMIRSCPVNSTGSSLPTPADGKMRTVFKENDSWLEKRPLPTGN